MADSNVVVRITVNADGTRSVSTRTVQDINSIGDAASQTSRRMDALAASSVAAGRVLSVALGGLGATAALKETIMLADSMTLLDARAKNATNLSARLRDCQQSAGSRLCSKPTAP
ncbi:MAG: hypothetical protein IPN33_25995 [Saprospiraceae bacterium]|nr:hypothetical protein [Saprospiraceae bacterium]